MNNICISGNITKDIEVKNTTTGKTVTSFDVAVKRPMTKDTTDFFTVVVWGQSAEYLGKYGRKGSKVVVVGKLTTRKWQDNNGNNRIAFEIVADNVELMDSRNATEISVAEATYVPDAYGSPSFSTDVPNFETVDDSSDLPF